MEQPTYRTLTDREILKIVQSALASTASFVYILDRDLKIVFASETALKNMNLTEEQVVGRGFEDLGIKMDDVRSYRSVVSEAFEKGEIQNSEVSYPMPNGRRFYSYEVVPVRLGGDREGLVVITARDVTARRTSELLGEVLSRVYAAINSTLNFQEIMDRVIAISSKVMDSEATAIALREGDQWVLRYRYGSIPPNAIGARLTDKQMRACFLSSHECTTGVADVRKTDWVSQEMMRRFNVLSFISIPLSVRAETIGVLIFAFTAPRPFSPEEMDFGTKLSVAVSLALENSTLYRQEMERRFLLQAILDDIPAVVIAMDGKDLSIKWANRYSDRYKFGQLKSGSTIGMRLTDIIPNAEVTGVAEMFKEVARSGRPFYSDNFMLSGLGDEVINWSGALVPLRTGGETPDLLILAVDVTEMVKARRRSEDLARTAEDERKRLQVIMDNLPVGVALVDRSGRIVQVNPTAMELWGSIVPTMTNIEDLENVPAWKAETNSPMRLEDWGVVRAVHSGETTTNQLVTLRRYDGREMVMLMSSTPLKDEHSRIIGAVVIGQDLTRQLQMQQEVVDAKTKAELYVDLLTHDINNLNTVAMGYLQLLGDTAGCGEKEKRWTDRSLEALSESSRLIENVRGIQQLESGDAGLTIVDLDGLLQRQAVEHAKHPNRPIDIRVSSRGQHCVLANQLITEVFANLLDNAVKHSAGQLNVEIRVSTVFETGKEYHRVDVEDNGPGIPDEMKERIFTRAWRGRTKAVGKGLGLFLVRRLVEDYHGRVWVEDRVVGDRSKGARFVVLLPAVSCQGP